MEMRSSSALARSRCAFFSFRESPSANPSWSLTATTLHAVTTALAARLAPCRPPNVGRWRCKGRDEVQECADLSRDELWRVVVRVQREGFIRPIRKELNECSVRDG